MSLLTLTDVRKGYGNQDVLNGASFFVAPGRRTALIGPNGAGKTTILRLITGEEVPDAGRVTLQPNAQVALLSQEPLVGDARTVLEAAQRPSTELQQVWQEMTTLEAHALEDEEALHRYDDCHHRYQDLRGYECENRAKEILAGLGFSEEAWSRPIAVLSGGERTRLALVQILVLQPDLLLLDEPTNHVDWEASEWLQEYLRRYPGAALIVSHDRYFLDDVVEEVVELERGLTRTYRGNYSEYSKKKAAEREQAEETHQRQLEEISRQEAVIQRLRSHRKFDSMHSREKTLEKLQETLTERPRDDRKLKARTGNVTASGREVMTVRGLAHGFGERLLFRDLNLDLERGERLAIVGPNGAGKTTLLKSLAGILKPIGGTVEYGYRVKPGYFAQDLSSLDPSASVFETIYHTGALTERETLQALHQFMFAGDAVEKGVGDLSGGERTRLALCRLLVDSPNLLLLDEPTNHLDIASREAVERALRNYGGSLVVVSHDRYFLDAVATRLLEIRAGGTRLFDGGYRRYRERFPQAKAAPTPAKKTGAPAPPPARTRTVSPGKRLPKVEAEIARQEARLKEVTELLGSSAAWSSAERAAALSGEYDSLNASLQALYAEWAELAEVAG